MIIGHSEVQIPNTENCEIQLIVVILSYLQIMIFTLHESGDRSTITANKAFKNHDPAVQSIISLTNSLVAKIITALVSTVSNLQLLFAEKCAKATHIFSAKILAYMRYLMIKVLTIR